jgi:uncharacterized protein YndB with AHSA1/START domain
MRILWMVLPVMVALLAAGATVAIVGLFLPKSHRATRSAHFAATPEAVWAVISDLAGHASWRPGVRSMTKQPDRDGRPVWLEEGGMRPMLMEVSELEPMRRMVTTIRNTDLPYGGSWTYELTPEGEGTLVRITEKGEIYNPAFRYLSLFFNMTGTIEGYLRSLGKKLGEEAVIAA